MTPCPSEEELVAFLLGTGQPTDTETVQVHIGQCKRCRDWLDDVQRDDDLMPDLRRVLEEDSDSRKLKASGQGGSKSPSARPTIEGYEILGELGRGGMGIVYLGFQQSTKRKVALKVLLEGVFASESAKRRFQREVELAAQLDHPNIVTVLESGLASGRYYCAMQFVEGKRLDHYVRDRSPSMEELLRLFDCICRAVSHAHQRGVIHRDLKPSNILVDGDGVPHVLDFGLAKQSIDDSDPDDQLTQISVTGQVMGTLPYMSPEQSVGQSGDIDVRSDVYALGVILYEMLTGKFPYPVVGHIGEVLRHIAETAPTRPSAANRRIDDEIETILLKSLAKEPQRRYQSAVALADDISCYLAGQTISAKRDSGWYVTRKLLRRYRYPVAAGLIVAATAVFSLAVYSGQRATLRQIRAADIVAGSTDDWLRAVAEYELAREPIRAAARAVVDRYVQSPVSAERAMGALLGPMLSEESFWSEIDGGALWQYGEWLELVDNDFELTEEMIEDFQGQYEFDPPRVRYVKMVLLGGLAAVDDALAAWCADQAKAEAHSGVASAADWAASQLGYVGDIEAYCDRRFVDELTGLEFLLIPAADTFAPGSPTNEPDRLADEDHTGAAGGVGAFFLARTETKWPIFSVFLNDPDNQDLRAMQSMDELFKVTDMIPTERRKDCAVGFVSKVIADRFCAWLNQHSESESPRRRYRLPTEIEWEYASRGGNLGRFCFGDDPKFLPAFARCNGEVTNYHTTGEFLPNFYGLQDMHGGLWELTETRYPDELIGDSAPLDSRYWVIRGGAYYSPAVRCRSAQRNFSPEDIPFQYLGLRLVVELMEP